ncbi:unnamed protein product, partial [Symbiodinium microadriaticum]
VAQLGQMYSSDVAGAIETAALSMPDFPAQEVCQHTQKMRDFTEKAPVFRSRILNAMSTWPLTRDGCRDSDRSFYAAKRPHGPGAASILNTSEIGRTHSTAA